MVVFQPGRSTFCGQVRAMAASRIVIGFSGADLTNSFFMPYDAVLIEIFNAAWFNTTNFGMSDRTPTNAVVRAEA